MSKLFVSKAIMRTTLDADVIEFLSTDEVEVGLARCLYNGKMPDRFIHQSDNIEDYNHLGVRPSKSYLESRLSRLLEKNIDNIAAQIRFGSELVSLSLNKNGSEKFLLQALSESKNVSCCVVSGSRDIIGATLSAVSDIVARKSGLVAFVEDLPLIQRYWRKPAVLCFLNNGFCVYEPDYLLALIHQAMGPDDIFLFDCHISSSRNGGIDDYAFCSRNNAVKNMSPLLQRGMQLDDCALRWEISFSETSVGRVQRADRWLDVLNGFSVKCGDDCICFEEGRKIKLGFNYIYTREQLMSILQKHNLNIKSYFIDRDSKNLLLQVSKE